MLRSPQAGCSARSGGADAQRFAFARSFAHNPDAGHRACKIRIRPDSRRSSGSPPESSCPTPFVAGEGTPSVKHSDGLHAGSCRR